MKLQSSYVHIYRISELDMYPPKNGNNRPIPRFGEQNIDHKFWTVFVNLFRTPSKDKDKALTPPRNSENGLQPP